MIKTHIHEYDCVTGEVTYREATAEEASVIRSGQDEHVQLTDAAEEAARVRADRRQKALEVLKAAKLTPTEAALLDLLDA